MADLVESLWTPLYQYNLGGKTGALDKTAAGAAATKDSAVLGKQISSNPNVDRFLDKLTAGKGPDAKPSAGATQLTDAIIKKWKSDPEFISKLNKDLANPQTAAKLEAAVKANPAGVAATLPQYTSGNLDAILPAAAAPAAAPTARTAPSAQPSTDASSDETARLARRPTSAQPAATPTPAPAATSAAAKPAPATPAVAPVEVAAAAVSAPDPSAPQPPSQKEISRGILREISKGSDAEIKAAMTPAFVERLGNGLADYGVDTYGKELEGDANAFRNKIKSDPALRQRIADNLQNNPQLVRGLSEAMDDPNAGKGMVGSAVKGKLKEIYTNPAALGDKDYTDKLTSDMSMAKGMGGGGMGGMLNGLFGSNMGGSMGGIINSIGGFLKGIMNWLGNFFKGFSSGNFSVMGNVDPKMSMWDKMSLSMDRAERANQMLPYAQVLPRDGTTNPKIGDGKVVGADGKPVMEPMHDRSGKVIGEQQKYDATQDHRVTVDGKKFYLTNGLQPTPVYDKNGTFTGNSRWIVATEVDASGRPTSVNEYVFNREDSEKLNQRVQQAARASGTTATFKDPATVPQQLEQSNISTQRVERVRGQYQGAAYTPVEAAANDPRVQSYPVAPQSPDNNRPLDPIQATKVADPAKPAGNDPEFAIKMGA